MRTAAINQSYILYIPREFFPYSFLLSLSQVRLYPFVSWKAHLLSVHKRARTPQKVHDHVMVFSLKLGILVTLVPHSLESSFSAWLPDDVEKFVNGVCTKTLLDGFVYHPTDFDPGR